MCDFDKHPITDTAYWTKRLAAKWTDARLKKADNIDVDHSEFAYVLGIAVPSDGIYRFWGIPVKVSA